MAQLFGQTEAPMMISMMPPADHFSADGTIAMERLSSAGRIGPLVQAGIMDGDGKLLPAGSRGEDRGAGLAGHGRLLQEPGGDRARPRCMAGTTPAISATSTVTAYLYIVDRAKDMIITGGFNVYSIEVENALRAHEAVQDCAVIGLPDDKWGERVVAVVQPRAGQTVDATALAAFVKQQIGSVKTPKQIEVWNDLPRSKVGKVLKPDIRARLA